MCRIIHVHLIFSIFPHSIVISTWLFTNSTTDSAPKKLWDVHLNQKPFLHGVYKQECEPFQRKRFKKYVNPLGCLILGKQAYVAADIMNIYHIYIYAHIQCPMAPPLKRSVLGTATWKASEYFSRLSQKPTWCTHRGIRKEDEETLCAVLRHCLQERLFRLSWVLREHRFIQDRPRWVVWSKSGSINNVLLSLRKKLPANIPTRSHQVVFSTPWFQALTLMIGARYLPPHAQAWAIFQLEIGEHRGTSPNHLTKGLLLFGEAKSILGHCDAWCDKNKNKNTYNNSSSQLSFLQCTFAYRSHGAHEIVWHSFPQMECLAFKRFFCHVSQLAKTT